MYDENLTKDSENRSKKALLSKSKFYNNILHTKNRGSRKFQSKWISMQMYYIAQGFQICLIWYHICDDTMAPGFKSYKLVSFLLLFECQCLRGIVLV